MSQYDYCYYVPHHISGLKVTYYKLTNMVQYYFNKIRYEIARIPFIAAQVFLWLAFNIVVFTCLKLVSSCSCYCTYSINLSIQSDTVKCGPEENSVFGHFHVVAVDTRNIFYCSGTSLKRTSCKAETSLRCTKNFVPDEFLRNPL